MSIHRADNHIHFYHFGINLEDIPHLVQKHLDKVPRTLQYEQEGSDLVEADFEDFKQVATFIRHVCHWGNYSGIADRVINSNTAEHIQNKFRHAICQGDAGDALCRVNKITELGKPSFASKHLRFLEPNRFAVLDSIIASILDMHCPLKDIEAFVLIVTRYVKPSKVSTSPTRLLEMESGILVMSRWQYSHDSMDGSLLIAGFVCLSQSYQPDYRFHQ